MRRVLLALASIVAIGLPAGHVTATPPTDVEFIVETSLVNPEAPFAADGPAVDAGLVCDAGIVVDDSGKVTGFSPNGFNFQGVKHFICEDGSGDFFVNLQARIDFRKGTTFQWNVLRGTGAYADLHGAGNGFGLPGVPCGNPDDCVFDVYFGGLHHD